MKALIYKEKNQPLALEDIAKPVPEKGQKLVKIKAAALNHRDVWITKGMYPGLKSGVIVGSDGAGEVDGRPVIINPSMGWGPNPDYQAKGYQILGMPSNGTFAEYLAIGQQQLYDKPSHLSWEEAAALPLGGLTAYRALFTKGKLQPGEKVLISGVGGGVALFAFQFALAAGAEVYVTSGKTEKIDKAVSRGAKGGANYKSEDWAEKLKEQAKGFDVIVDSAGGDGFANFLKLARPSARIVTYGGTRGKYTGLSPQVIFWKQLSILGTSMGNDQEFADMVDFVGKHRIKPVVDATFSLEESAAATERMDKGLQFGKIVFQVDV